jgi:hypothetical protein
VPRHGTKYTHKHTHTHTHIRTYTEPGGAEVQDAVPRHGTPEWFERVAAFVEQHEGSGLVDASLISECAIIYTYTYAHIYKYSYIRNQAVLRCKM